jgi:CRP/FNR family transcriptional regulator, cyclic AMP receptor protein
VPRSTSGKGHGGGQLTSKTKPAFQVTKFLTEARDGRTVKAFKSEKIIFAQGDSADAIFYIQKGKVKLTVLSKRGKEAVIAVLGPCGFFGEGCLAGQSIRMSTATAMTDCSIMRLTRATVVETLRPETVIPKISQETLAEMVGTTRSRVSFFMNKFRRLGFIKYNGTLEVHSSLLNVVLHD